MFVHQEAQDFHAASFGDGIALFFIEFNQRAERVQQTIQRMLFIVADLIKLFIESFYGGVVFALITNGEQGRDILPVKLNLVDFKSHFSNLLGHILHGSEHDERIPCRD